MCDFKKCFSEYGADYDATMPRFMGNETLYLKLLNMMFQDDNLQKLGVAISAKDITGAFVAAHTLKGVVGNMGLKPLYEAICEIVEPLRDKQWREDYNAMYQKINLEFQKVDKFRHELIAIAR